MQTLSCKSDLQAVVLLVVKTAVNQDPEKFINVGKMAPIFFV